MSQEATPTSGRLPNTPLTPSATKTVLPALGTLSAAITQDDDDTPANKLRFSVNYLMQAADRLGVDLTPIPQPDFNTETLSPSGVLQKPAPATSPRYSPALGASSFTSAINDILSRYNPSGNAASSSPSPSAFAATSAKKLSAAGAGADPAVALPQQMSLSQQVQSAEVQALRARFATALADAKFPWTKNNSTRETSFSEEEVNNITRTLFDEVFNVAGLKRAVAVVNAYRKSSNSATPLSATAKARHLAMNDALPSDVRNFYSAFESSIKSSLKSSAAIQMLTLYNKYNLYNQYLRLVNQPSASLRALLSDAGLSTTQGKGWNSVLLDYLRMDLGLSKAKLSNILQETQCVQLMAATFGVGILLLVPGGIVNFLQRMGVQKLTQIFATAQEVGLIDAVMPVCQRAMQSVIQPIIYGHEFPRLGMEEDEQPQALIDLVSYTQGEDEMDLDVDLEEPEVFQALDSDAEESEWGGIADVSDQGEENALFDNRVDKA